MSQKREILRVERIKTDHRGIRILTDAKLNLFDGETVGVLGVNYSGKTALAGAICGFFPCTDGKITYMEQFVSITSLTQAREMGIFYIQQESTLVDEITVFDNFMLTSSNHSILITNRKKYEEDIRDVLSIFGVEYINTELKTEELSEYEHLAVEVSKAILSGVKVIVFDNVLSSVSFNIEKDVNRMISCLRSMDICIVLIEAKYKYLEKWCDRIFVMRSGRIVGIFDRSVEEEKLISLMMGYPTKRLADEQALANAGNREKGLLVMEHIVTLTGLNDFSFSAYEGEITGMLFLEKESQRALESLLEGTTKNYKGRIFYKGMPLKNRKPDQLLNQGIVFIQEDNLFTEASFKENILLSAYKKTSRGVMLNASELKYILTELVSRYFSDYEDLYNKEINRREDWLFRKKIMLCRGLATKPDILVFVNPTVHSDFDLRQQYYEDVLSIKEYGASGLILSTDLEELLALCDRIIIVKDGKAIEQRLVDADGVSVLKRKFSAFLKEIT